MNTKNTSSRTTSYLAVVWYISADASMAAQQANQTEVPQQELFQWQESHPEIHNKTTIYLHIIHTHTRSMALFPGLPRWLVAWHSGRTSVSGRRTFPVLRSTCSWWVTTNVGKPSTTGQSIRPTQPFILSGSIKWVVSWNQMCAAIYR